MKFCALFLLILLSCFSSFAQPPVATANPTVEVPEDWQKFAPPEDEFTVEAPGTVSNGIFNTAAINSEKNRSYITKVAGTYYFMFSDPVSSPLQNREVYLFSESQAPGLEPNEIYTFMDNLGYFHKLLVIKNNDRVYTFQTVSLLPDDPQTVRFFDGIKVKGNAVKARERAAQQGALPESDKNKGVSFRCSEPPPPPPPVKTGNGISNAEPSPAPLPAVPASVVPAETTPITISTKPRPNYTDGARFYQIAGEVMLRVTFLANGKIGTVSSVKRLPFGLTEQAVMAACQIEFKPATKNGIPLTVTKQVQYNFTLF